jgi:hypothetical protein
VFFQHFEKVERFFNHGHVIEKPLYFFKTHFVFFRSPDARSFSVLTFLGLRMCTDLTSVRWRAQRR